MNILRIVCAIMALIYSLIIAVESPGNGADKKAAVLDALKKAFTTLALPPWATFVFGNDFVLGLLVDLLVSAMNRSGDLFHGVIDAINPTSPLLLSATQEPVPMT